MSKKSQKRKKAISSLLKFLKNRKSVSVALGVCLAIAASAYVATAKFSADNPKGLTDLGLDMVCHIRVVDNNGKPVQGVVVLNSVVQNGKAETLTDYPDKTGPDGYSNYNCGLLQKDSKGRIYKTAEDSVIITGEGGSTKGGKIIWWKKSPVAISLDDLNKRYEKRSDGNYNAPTIVLKSDGRSGKVNPLKSTAKSSNSSIWVITDQKIKYTVKVVDQNGKPVSGSAVTMAWSSSVNIKDNTKGKNATTSMGLTKSDGTVIFNAVAINICKKGSQQKSCYKIGDSVFFIGKLTPNVWKDGKKITKNTSYFSSYNTKDKTITIRMGTSTSITAKAGSAVKVAAGKVSTAAKKVTGAIIGSSKSAKVNTTPTSKDKATFSEALPAAKTSMTKTLNFQIKKSNTLTPGTVKITVKYKECTTGGCGGATGDSFKLATFTKESKNGTGYFNLGVVNIPQVKTSLILKKKTTENRYFFFYGDTTKIVRSIYISDVNGNNQKEIPIGGYPFATKTEAATQKFQIKLFTYSITAALPSGTAAAITPTTPAATTQSTIGTVQSDGNGPTDPEAAGRPAGQ